MASSPFRRIYLVRRFSALFLCLPGIALCFWYAFSAYSRFDSYKKFGDEEPDLTIELFRLQLYDVLRSDLRNLFLDAPPDPSNLESFAFHISTESLNRLYRGAEKEDKRPYVPANVERNGALQSVEIRLRGQRHWYLLGKQKSMKVKLPKGELLDGHRVFNLLNDPSPMVVDEQIILDLSQGKGVLTPVSRFARVRINASDLGVFHYETQPDESLLRVNRRFPGSIYSGDLPPSAKTHELWDDTARWKKVAWRIEREKEDFSDLKRLLSKIRNATVAEFTRFAREEIDLEAFATFDAIDIAFGGDQHDFRENHKYFLDPYRGRWEPIAWNYRGFQSDPLFNLVENPFLLRLKFVPEYLKLRNAILYDFLVKEGSVTSVRNRGIAILKKLAAGTHFRMGPKASLIFRGRVHFNGSRIDPIIVGRASGERWGGIALQGLQTNGSVLQHVIVTDGSRPSGERIPYPGMINIHDTGNITVRNCRFSDNQVSDDVVHASYVKGLLVEDCTIENGYSDAWDLEFVKAELKRLRVRRVGDDALDLMGSEVVVSDSVVSSCRGNGVSSGEETRATIRNTLIADSRVGVLVKNASTAELFSTLLYRNQIGVRVYQREVRFEGDSRIEADVLFIVDGKRAIKRSDRTRDLLDSGRFQRGFPRNGILDNLRENVIGLPRWEKLSGWLQTQSKSALIGGGDEN